MHLYYCKNSFRKKQLGELLFPERLGVVDCLLELPDALPHLLLEPRAHLLAARQR